MIIEQKSNSVISQGIKGSVSFGIKQDGLAHIFNVLRNQLYSDKILAVLREYSCNAVDAHTEAGISETPIRVNLPTLISPEVKIRDFGAGLTDSEIKDIYAFYGESTKRKSNALIGQLGLGSKSAFAYGDNFLINSYVGGTKTSYNAFIDDSQVGQIAKMNESATDEPNGVEIVIPVRNADINYFWQKAASLYRFFPVRPEIVGNRDFKIEMEEEVYRNTHGLFRQNSRVYGGRNSVAIMGCIGYTINPASMQFSYDNDNDKLCDKLLNSVGMELFFDIGELDIAASREGLQYTEKTIKAIKAKILAFNSELGKHISKTIASAPSLWASRKMVGNLNDTTHPFSAFSGLTSSITWNGKRVEPLANFDTKDNVMFYTPRVSYYGGSNRLVAGGKLVANANRVQLSENVVFIENTKKFRNGLVGYAYNFLKDHKNVLIVSFNTPQDRAAFMSKQGLIESDFVDIKSLQRLILPRNTRNGVVSSSPRSSSSKHSKNVFVMRDASKMAQWRRAQSDCWEEETIDFNDPAIAENYAWVEINRFMPVIGKSEIAAREASNALTLGVQTLANVMKGKVKIPKIIGIKSRATGTIKVPKIKSLEQFVKDELIKLEKATSFGELLWGIEMYNAAASDNPILGYMLTTFGSAKNVQKVVTDLRNLKYNLSEQVFNANRALSIFRFQADEIRNPVSDRLKKIEKNYKQVDALYGIVKYVDTMNLHSFRGKNKACEEAIVKCLEHRDSELNGILEKV
jgi:hypothetical protein